MFILYLLPSLMTAIALPTYVSFCRQV